MKTNYRVVLRRSLLDVRMRNVTLQWRTTIRRSKKNDKINKISTIDASVTDSCNFYFSGFMKTSLEPGLNMLE